MKRFLLILIVVIQSSSCALFSSEQRILTDAIFPRTDPKLVGIIYQMLQVTDIIFTSHGIPYWVDGGTALGAIRHQGFIPWDDDADLAFHIQDKEKILALAREFELYGYFLSNEEIIKLYPSREKRYPFIDIGGYALYSDNKIRFAHDAGRLSYVNFYWLPKEVSSLIRVKFGPIMLNAPNNMMRYLFTGYGNNCLTKATFQTHHGAGDNHIVIHEEVYIVDFSPAEYEIENSNNLYLQ